MLIIAGTSRSIQRIGTRHSPSCVNLVTRAREAPGYLDLAITADSVDPTRINNFERWESRAH